MADVITTSAGVFVPDIIGRELVKGFSGRVVLNGSSAVIVMPGLKVGANGVGSKVIVPYVANIGEFDALDDGQAIETVPLLSVAEEDTVQRFGKGVNITRGGMGAVVSNGRTPDEIAAGMLRAGAVRGFDSALISAAIANVAGEWDSYTHDISGNTGTAAYASFDACIETIGLLGDEGLDPNEYAMVMMHSKTVIAFLKMKDANGRHLLIPELSTSPSGQQSYTYRFLGIPIKVTDRLSPSAGVYKTVFLRKGSLALYFDATPGIDIDRVGSTDSWRMDCNVYAIPHRYVHLDQGSKPGVAVIVHKNPNG